MIISRLKTNRMINPLGFHLDQPRLSYVVSETGATKQVAAQIRVALDEAFTQLVYDSGRSTEINSLAHELPIRLKPRTRYYWQVTVWADNGEEATSGAAWFETAKQDEGWEAEWITPKLDRNIHPVLGTTFALNKEVLIARAYVCGLGLYELELNGRRAGEEYLAPNFNAYDKWLQYQTYDITDLLQTGLNTVEAMLGNGLYKGRFGFQGGKYEVYGDRFSLLCELVITHTDGSVTSVYTDESWYAKRSKVLASGLYDGEHYDATLQDETLYGVEPGNIGYDKLQARRSLPVIVNERLKPIKVLTTPRGETVLDLGQNMVGWIQFRDRAPKGTELLLQYGELLQEGCFYQENLRTARAEYRYVSDGVGRWIRPHFTYYGFRYVKLSGWVGEVNPEDFIGCVLHSEMERIGSIETSDPLVNRLFLNALWGQKGNFLDVPTDCPQRDERMGWTGDAQVFAGTASFNMDSYAFFSKYSYDLWQEQAASDGMVPFVVPVTTVEGGGSSAWGDAATIIPWTVYLHTGDKAILEQQFDSMKAWVDYIKREDDASGVSRLWTVGFHFGDWLALDGEDPSMPAGGTDTAYISSAYYSYSAMLVAKAADVLGRTDLARQYKKLSDEVKEAIRNEYFTPNGRIALNTQTALIVALFMDLALEKDRARVARDLRERLKKDRNYLKTGFVGTPYLCRVLSDAGMTELAYTLLLNKDYPSWLYAVTMGATTIWERWNSVLPDGKISGTDMNSLNHYAYGSIAEWMYRHMAGINPLEESPGFKRVRLAPEPNYRLKYVRASLQSAAGLYESGWELSENGELRLRFSIPFDATAEAELPDARIGNVRVNGMSLQQTAGLRPKQTGRAVLLQLPSGVWEFVYRPEIDYIIRYSTLMPLKDVLSDDEARKAAEEVVPQLASFSPDRIKKWGNQSLRELADLPFLKISAETLDALDGKLKKIIVKTI